MCIRGLGAHTKTGSIVLTAATSGGAVVPAIMGAVNEKRGLQYGFCVAVASFSLAAALPIYVEVVPAAKAHVDPSRDSNLFSHSYSISRPLEQGQSGPVRIRRARSELLTTEDYDKDAAAL